MSKSLEKSTTSPWPLLTFAIVIYVIVRIILAFYSPDDSSPTTTYTPTNYSSQTKDPETTPKPSNPPSNKTESSPTSTPTTPTQSAPTSSNSNNTSTGTGTGTGCLHYEAGRCWDELEEAAYDAGLYDQQMGGYGNSYAGDPDDCDEICEDILVDAYEEGYYDGLY